MQSEPTQNSKPADASAGTPSLAASRFGLITLLAAQLAENKPGIQTTECAFSGIALIVIFVLVAIGKMPTAWAGVVAILVPALYHFQRNNRKSDREGSTANLINTLLDALAHASVYSASLTRLTPNTNEQELKAADVPAPQPVQPSPAPVSAPSAPVSGTAAFAQLRVLVCLAGAFLSLAGCAALEKFQADPRVQFAEQEALKIGVAALQTYSNGGNIDSMWGISEGLYAVTDTISALSSNKSNADANNALALQLAQTVQSYASTQDTKALAGKIAAIITKADPQTDAQRVAMVNSIAGSLQAAATVAPAAATSGKAIVPTQAARKRATQPGFRQTLVSERGELIYPVVITHQD